MTRTRLSSRSAATAALLLGLIGSLTACSTGQNTASATTASAPSTTPSVIASSQGASESPSGPSMVTGSYVTYEQYQSTPPTSGAVVLFFHAPWCPDCRASDAALTSAGVPDGVTVVKVDFDSMTDVRKKYGITQQHTFVQVDRNGTLVKKWSGSKDGNAIKTQLG